MTKAPFYTLASLKNCDPNTTTTTCNGDTNLPEVKANAATVKSGLQFLFMTISVITIIYIIISAIKYNTSLGNPEATAKLRNSIIYAAIGLGVALSAEVLVTFTLGRL